MGLIIICLTRNEIKACQLARTKIQQQLQKQKQYLGLNITNDKTNRRIQIMTGLQSMIHIMSQRK